uniref:Uncharacterized protein n=1 Tax=Theileria annulata TaxID=5874 RepID=A0A3B0MJX8_THEAN
MDYSLLVLVSTWIFGIYNTPTPALCSFPSSFSLNSLDDDSPLNNAFSFKDEESIDSYTTKRSSELTEPDSSGDPEFVPGNLNAKSESPEVIASVESIVLSETPDDETVSENDYTEDLNSEVDQSENVTRDDNNEDDVQPTRFFDKLSTEYSDDFKKSTEEGIDMDSEKSYTVRSLLPVDNLLVLTTPSGCSLLDFSGEDDGLQVVEFNFKTSELEECSKLTEDIIREMNEQLARDLVAHRNSQATPRTKMVEISVRDPMRNRQLNIKETQEVFSRSDASNNENLSDSSSFRFGDEVDVTEEDRKEALLLLSRTLDFDYYPTDADSVYVMSFSLSDNEGLDSNREQLLNEFYQLFNTKTDSRTEGDSSGKTLNKESTGEKMNLENIFKNLSSYSEEKLEKLLDEMKAFLETDEGKKAVEKFQSEMASKLKEVEKLYREESELGKKILSDLSKHGVENVQCSKLTSDDCTSYSKCQVLKVDGKDVCFVSPKTIYWLLQTKCGLQSKAALLSIARDLNNIGIISNKHVNNLEQSFDLNKICNAITHSYLSKLSPNLTNLNSRSSNSNN